MSTEGLLRSPHSVPAPVASVNAHRLRPLEGAISDQPSRLPGGLAQHAEPPGRVPRVSLDDLKSSQITANNAPQKYAGWAESARLDGQKRDSETAHNPKVAGSNPAPAIHRSCLSRRFLRLKQRYGSESR